MAWAETRKAPLEARENVGKIARKWSAKAWKAEAEGVKATWEIAIELRETTSKVTAERLQVTWEADSDARKASWKARTVTDEAIWEATQARAPATRVVEVRASKAREVTPASWGPN